MTEKEKKEIFGNIEPNFNTNLANGTITINLDYYNCLEEYIRRILDELEQKDEEIRELKSKHYFITGLRAGKTLMAQNLERAREFEILTKMVDEMAGEIAYLNYETIGDWCKEEQCEKFKMKENHQRECDTNNHDCIKQYFREKVRNEKWNQ